ncbi:hypothetical protein O3M35_005278 [Rhynocoris fuscipes]|uniref:DNA topoisomerase (ATP-hydrolyzing) n=1 Tax=Rhynocoris fuscipes TaxID=488301 RepID=A0AAW1DLD9_9HEMI
MMSILQALTLKQIPKLTIRNQKCWSNCTYQDERLRIIEDAVEYEIKFSSRKSQEEFAIIIHLLGKIYLLLTTQKTCTKRELYYQNVELVGNQKRIDSAIDKISCLLKVPPWELGVLATSKGLIAGPLTIITDSNSVTDCSVQGGTLIPQDVGYEMHLETEAKFILLIEKDTIFQKLLDENFIERNGPCLMITGKGVPDMNTRVLVKCLHERLSLPIFMIADADPYGIEIMSIYRFGSMNLSHLADILAVPSILWIGVHPSDLTELKPETEALSEIDLRRTRSLVTRPYMADNKELLKQVNLLLELKVKCKIENIGNISTTYLTNLYIPMKILTKQFI